MKELSAAQKKKEIDRRATKGRKIKYIVHDKLQNFMTPLDSSTFTLDGKDSILKNLFGHRSQQEEGKAFDLFAEVNS